MMSEEALDLSSDINNNSNSNSSKCLSSLNNTSTICSLTNNSVLNNSTNAVASMAAATMAAVSMLKLEQQHKDINNLAINNNSNNNIINNNGNHVEINHLFDNISTALLQTITDDSNRQNTQLQTALATLLSPGSVISPWLSTKSALGSILQQLPVPSSSLVNSFSSLHSLYASIHTTCLSLDKLLEQYFVLFVSAFLKVQNDKNNNGNNNINNNNHSIQVNSNINCGGGGSSTPSTAVSGQSSPPFLINNSSPPILNFTNTTNNNCHKRKSLSPLCPVKPSKSPILSLNDSSLDTSITNNTNNDENSLSSFLTQQSNNLSISPNLVTPKLFKRKKLFQNPNQNNLNSSSNTNGATMNKKSNFRGTSEAENEIDQNFQPREINGEIVLCDEYSSVRLDRDVYSTLTSKAPRSATRLIRLLMKHFFSQEVLARSSLSGEGIYKDRLQPEVIEAIKLYIKRRHPKLKNGSINLCMTDVCVQARRVNKNNQQRTTTTNGGRVTMTTMTPLASSGPELTPPPPKLQSNTSDYDEEHEDAHNLVVDLSPPPATIFSHSALVSSISYSSNENTTNSNNTNQTQSSKLLIPTV